MGEAGHFVRYLNQRGAFGDRFPFRQRSQPEENALGLGKLRAGYGMIFRDDSLLVRGRNGTAWEEPGCLYVKATFRF